MKLTQERLRELLFYDPLTGVFSWVRDQANQHKGERAGYYNDGRYIRITIDYVSYRAHHLAWFWMTGEWPSKFIDHRDLDKQNNVWANLREATKSQNHANRAQLSTNSSGLKGAHRYKAGAKYGKPWQAGIGVNGKRINLGHFSTAEEAHAAYCIAAQKYYGEFARAA